MASRKKPKPSKKQSWISRIETGSRFQRNGMIVGLLVSLLALMVGLASFYYDHFSLDSD